MHRSRWILLLLAVAPGAALRCGGRTPWVTRDGGSNPSTPQCGNGHLEAGEMCDSANLGGVTCQDLGYTGGALGCTATCRHDTSGCIVPPDCGNQRIDAGEECDTRQLGDATCEALGFAGGELYCTDACRYDTSACRTAQGCGDGDVDPGEQCDDGNRADCDGCSAVCRNEVCGNAFLDCGETCDDGNTQSGDGCSPACQLEWLCGNGQCEVADGESCALCPQDCCGICGNNEWDPDAGEECDGPDLQGRTCLDFCYDGGTLSCTSGCLFDLSQCTGTPPQCGDGVVECEEECDGRDLGGESCQTLGYASGELQCTGSCAFDTSGCDDLYVFLYEDFEDPGEVYANWTFTGDWEVGTPTGVAGEPQGAYDGTYCLGTRMGIIYSHNQSFLTNMAISPEIDLSQATVPRLLLNGWLAAEQGHDGVNVWIKPTNSTTWMVLDDPTPPYNTTLDGQQAWSSSGAMQWNLVIFDLSPWVGRTIRIAFAMHTDGSVAYGGTYVDNVMVTNL